MYQLDLGSLSIEAFLRDYWQQKPLLIKGGFTPFADPLTADELAGLALEDRCLGGGGLHLAHAGQHAHRRELGAMFSS